MEGIKSGTAFARMVAMALGDELFTLVDVGCSGGIDAAWRVFESRLRAFGFDPNLGEVARLTEQEPLSGVTYVPAFVGLDESDEGKVRLDSGSYTARNPWGRLSAMRTLARRQLAAPAVDSVQSTKLNLWTEVALADPETPVVIPTYLREHGVRDVDFIKIDVDGADFLILRSLVPLLGDASVLGVGIEVNFFGSEDPDINTFHNIDRLLKKHGFELFGLTTRPYSLGALPAPYQLNIPAQTIWGRIYQGDALYFRDAVVPEQARWAKYVDARKLLKLAALYSMAGLPDNAAEVLLCFRSVLAAVFDVSAGLDALTAQCIPEGESVPSYADYIREFESEGRRFYPAIGGASAGDIEGALEAFGVEPRLARYDEVAIATSNVEILASSSEEIADWPLRIETPADPWAYAAVLRIPAYVGDGNARQAIVRIRTASVQNQIWFGALTSDETNFIRRHMIPEGAPLSETVLGPVDLTVTSKLVIENGAGFEASSVIVEHASVLIPLKTKVSE